MILCAARIYCSKYITRQRWRLPVTVRSELVEPVYSSCLGKLKDFWRGQDDDPERTNKEVASIPIPK